MHTNTKEASSNMLSILLLIGAAIWSVLRMFSWMISLLVGYLLAVYEACQSIALKKSSQDVTYNLINYPDEVSTDF
jgi:hypothetical protein